MILFFASMFMLVAAQSVLASSGSYALPAKITIAGILQKLQTAGYALIKEIKYENGVYRVKGLDDSGAEVKALISADTGEIPANLRFSKVKPVETPIDVFQAVQKIVDKGYSDIRQLDSKKTCYEIKVFDSKGKKIEFKVDKITGSVSRDWL